jgi:transposase
MSSHTGGLSHKVCGGLTAVGAHTTRGVDMEPEKIGYAAWVGLDWGSYKHALCLQPAGSREMEHYILEQKPEALHGWFRNLLARFGGQKVAIAIEQTRGAVIHFLIGFESVHIFPINPRSLKNYRDALQPSGAKDDPVDAELLLQFLTLHQDRLKPWIPDEPDVRLLLRLVEFRRKMVGKRTRLTNELTQLLKEYFPAALDCAGGLDTVMACDFLLKWPTLEKLQKSRAETIRKFYHVHNMRGRNAIEDRLKEIRSALPLTTDAPVIEPSVFMVKSIARQLHSVIDVVTLFDQRIAEIFQQLPDAGIFSSFPGAGPALAPRLLAAMGSDRSRFRSSLEVAQYSGIAPVTERSGKSKWVHRRFACSKFVKQSFHEFAERSILFCDWARCYYDQKKKEGKRYHSAIRALAYRWIRIIYRCWKDRTPYDEDKYLKSLRQRKPAWLESLPLSES